VRIDHAGGGDKILRRYAIGCSVLIVSAGCPSFYRADIIHNPTWFDRFASALRRSVIGLLQRRREAQRIVFAD
jgi:hypothetical protein